MDNVPSNYTVENFRDEIIKYLMEEVSDIFPLLKKHVEKCNRSYKDLVLALHQGKEMQSGIDFYMAAARLFLAEPILFIKPVAKDNAEENGPDYEFKHHYFLDGDEKTVPKIKLIFNGIDYYTPIYPEQVASIMREGESVLRDIARAYEDISSIMLKMLPGRSINGGLRTIQVHLQAATAIAKSTSFATGCSDPTVTDQPAPAMDPLIAGTVEK